MCRQFLSVLKAAQHAPSPEHDSLVAFLREDAAAAAAGRLAASDEPASPWAPRPGTIPLLTKVEPRPGSTSTSTSTTAPRYEATLRPLPRAQLTGGVRKLPLLESGNGIPFLRLGKPQSPVLSRVVRQKGARLQKQIAKRKALAEEDLVAAREEDQWDGLMRDLGAREESVQKARFADPVVASIADARAWLVADREDRVARAKAMWDIVVKERALAEKETEERKARRKERWETIKAARSIAKTNLGTHENSPSG